MRYECVKLFPSGQATMVSFETKKEVYKWLSDEKVKRVRCLVLVNGELYYNIGVSNEEKNWMLTKAEQLRIL